MYLFSALCIPSIPQSQSLVPLPASAVACALLFSDQVVLPLCDPMGCSTPGFPSFTVSPSLLKLMSTEPMMPCMAWCSSEFIGQIRSIFYFQQFWSRSQHDRLFNCQLPLTPILKVTKLEVITSVILIFVISVKPVLSIQFNLDIVPLCFHDTLLYRIL